MTNDALKPVTHMEAHEAAQRLINSHFRQEPHARVSIPARPDYDDDLRIMRYIEEQEARAHPQADAPAPSLALAHEALRKRHCESWCEGEGCANFDDCTALPGAPAPAASAVADEAWIRAEEAEACARMFAKFHWDAVLNEQIAAKIRSRIPAAEAARIEAERVAIEAVLQAYNSQTDRIYLNADIFHAAQLLARLTAPCAGGK